MTFTLVGQIAICAVVVHQVFVILLLLTRPEVRRDHSRAIAAFFVVNALTSAPDLQEIVFGDGRSEWLELLTLPFTMVMAPALYLYARALVAPERLRLTRKDAGLLLPFAVATCGCLLMVGFRDAAPTDALSGEDAILSWRFWALAFGAVVTLATFLVANTYFVVRTIAQLTRYRRARFDHFAALEGKSLGWLEWMMGLIVCIWVFYFASSIYEIAAQASLVSADMQRVVEAGWVYALSFMVLWQQAIFDHSGRHRPDRREEDAEPPESQPDPGTASAKYQRSALDDARSRRIIGKLERAMAEQRLYRTQTITLRSLSDITGVSENYLSQALNEGLKRNFYEFVNHWRIKEACELLRSDAISIIEIGEDVGFNSRSTFNAAFKKETGMTPSEYRALHRAKEQAAS